MAGKSLYAARSDCARADSGLGFAAASPVCDAPARVRIVDARTGALPAWRTEDEHTHAALRV
ncbi:hypothetical protein XabCFBP2524_20245 [Xanthomonas axonopodis pv. begoniae]|nr:hypothetical protein XabCFBP2524_20245 [Xanthomonas axonopodis pv. begoniae]